MEITERLALYHKALRDFRLGDLVARRRKKSIFWRIYYAVKKDDLWTALETRDGFCVYFTTQNTRHSLKEFPELMQAAKELQHVAIGKFNYWVPAGDRESRIKILERAIEICETRKDD